MSRTVCPQCKFVKGHAIKCPRGIEPSRDMQEFQQSIQDTHDAVKAMKETLGAEAMVMGKNGKPQLSKKGHVFLAQFFRGLGEK